MTDNRTVELERMKLIILTYLDQRIADEFAMEPKLEISPYLEFVADSLAVRLKQEVYGRQVERVDVCYPADWWQSFKARWFPEWAKRRWPVIEVHKVLEAKELYPKLAMLNQEAVLHLDIRDGYGGCDDQAQGRVR